MGKPKTKGKKTEVDDTSDQEVGSNEIDLDIKPTVKQAVKDKRKKKNDDWEADVVNELATLSLDANKGKKDPETNNGGDIVPTRKKEKKSKMKHTEPKEEQLEEKSQKNKFKIKKQGASDEDSEGDTQFNTFKGKNKKKQAKGDEDEIQEETHHIKSRVKKSKHQPDSDEDVKEEDSKPHNKGKVKKILADSDEEKMEEDKQSNKRKGKKTKVEYDSDSDIDKNKKTSKLKGKHKAKKVESDDEEISDVEEEITDRIKNKNTGLLPNKSKSSKFAAFSVLSLDDEEDKSMSDHSDNETKSAGKEGTDDEAKPADKPETLKKKKDKKPKGKEKKKTVEEEAVDSMLAEIEKPKEKKKKKDKKKGSQEEEMENTGEDVKPVVTEVQKVELKVITMDELEEDDKKKRKKKKDKGKKEQDEEEEEIEDGDEDMDEGGTVKTAAQKKKEKKERDRLKKLEQKKKQVQKKDIKTEDKAVENKVVSEEKENTTTLSTVAPRTAEPMAAEKEKASDDEDEDGGKKKKKKKKGEKEDKKKSKAQVAAIKEILKKQKEEEERLQREEEERIRKEEEAIAAAIEKKRLEEERKQRKKEKEKERKQRLKEEGKLLTAQQKQERLRQQQFLETLKAQGQEIPQKEEVKDDIKKKKPVYDKKKRKPQQKIDYLEFERTPSPDDTPAPTPSQEEAKSIGVEAIEKVENVESYVEVVPATVDLEETAGMDYEEIKEEWDVSSEEEEEEESVDKESSPEIDAEVKHEPQIAEDEDDADDSEDDNEEENSEEDEKDSKEDDDEEDSETESESDEEDEEEEELTPYQRAEIKIKKHHEICEANRTTDVLRAPVVCVLGHVDTGKTKILDKLRKTNVQDGEAGGITQQIGATNVPHQAILDKTTMCKDFQKKELKVPGLLIIDTPGHESFSNLRSRGSSLCDIAILVIDIMHGIEPQTIESINLLKDKKTPFVVALNKIDRLYQWKSNPNNDVVNTIKKQGQMTNQEFVERSRAVITQLAEQGLNAALFYENKNPKEYISLVPTSAISGDGMGNLLALICELTQTWLAKKVSYSEELHATVMEVKSIHGLGTTIDVILVNGKLREGDHIVIAGTEGPIITQIRGLLMPQPLRELRVKSQYEHHKEVLAAQGVKIIGKDLEHALAGLPLYVASDSDEMEYYKEEIAQALKEVLNSIKISERGVFVQASTLGSLEALLEFLRTSKIPFAGINIGPVHRKDVMKASIMIEHDPQWAVILAFDVKVERDAQEIADSLGVRIFTADIIYHLQDKFLKYREDLKKQKQDEFKNIAVFPCKLRVLPQFIFNTRDPIVVGVSVEAGILKIGTPICVPSKEFVFLGQVTSIEVNHKAVDVARKGQEVCVKIENIPGETPKLYGRHFDHNDILTSRISRASIDAVKDYFRDDMTKQDWALMVELKKLFQIL